MYATKQISPAHFPHYFCCQTILNLCQFDAKVLKVGEQFRVLLFSWEKYHVPVSLNLG